MPNTTDTPPSDQLPVIIIGAGPVGLAAAAHVLQRGLTPVVLEAGASVDAALTQCCHALLCPLWQHNIHDRARRQLDAAGWYAPDPHARPSRHYLLDGSLPPLCEALGARMRT